MHAWFWTCRQLLPIGGPNARSEITIRVRPSRNKQLKSDSRSCASREYFGNDCRFGNCVLRPCGRAAIHGRVAQHERMSPFRAGPAGLKPGDLLNLSRGSKACPERSRREQGRRPKDHCANLKAREFPPFRGIANQLCGRAAIHGRVARHERMSPFRAGPAGPKLGDLLNLFTGL